MTTLWQDIRYAIRTLRQAPAFTAIAILTLTLGIGANTAIFSVVNSTLLAPLPFKDASQLTDIHAHAAFFDFWNLGLSLPDINDLRSQSKSFSAVVPFEYATVDLTGRDAPQQLDAANVPVDFFSMLGLRPLYGRTFLPSEMQEGADREAILSGTLWRTTFGSDPRIVGKSVTLDGKPYTVVGVMPEMPKTFLPTALDIWTPFVPSHDQLAQRGEHGIPVLARLKPGVTLRRAQSELDSIAGRLAKAYPNEDKGWSFRADFVRTDMTRETRTPLLILCGAVGFVLLIACANVGNLFLSRGWARRRELAIRVTLGATRARIIRQLLVESLLLAVAGGACGLLVASWGVSALKVKTLAGSVAVANGITIDTRVLLFTLGVSILAGLLFGLAPAFLSSRHDLSAAMKESGAGAQTGASSSRQNPLRQILVVTEVALALVLVISATLALRSFSHLLRVNLGFDTERVLAMGLDFPAAKFQTSADLFAYVRTLTERIRSTPGIESICATTNGGPLSGSHGEGQFLIEGAPENPKAQLSADWSSVGPGYFTTLGVPLLRGRDFNAMDQLSSARVLIVNQEFVQKFFGGQNPAGKRVWLGDQDEKHNRIWNEIVGEVGDVRDWSPHSAPRPEMYAPFYQSDFAGAFKSGFEVDLLLRARANPETLISAAQAQVWALDKNQPISRVETMQQRVVDSDASPRFQTFLLGVFGALGLVLALVGIYGVISYSVTQRTHEIGIRMALGAEPGEVMRLILAHGLKLALMGVAIGVGASLALTRLMSSLLFGVSATDPLTFAGVAILLTIVALAACYVPARRAMKVDPMVALRYE